MGFVIGNIGKVEAMANIFDYIDWRGDLDLTQDPFNEVDSLILSTVSYIDFELIETDLKTEKATIREAGEQFNRLHADEKIKAGRLVPDSIFRLLDVMSRTPRFRDMILSDYVNQIDEEEEKQFSAITINLGDGSYYIAYRGTDDTIVGWKEDFNMSFIMPVPSQEAAVEYINSTCQYIRGRLYIGGHSKGGNLAIYSAVKCSERVRKKIDCVYNNDGPGFDVNMIKSAKYQAMLPLIKSIVPENSIVGMLLEHDEDYIIVKSSQSGLMQHDAMSWQVLGAFLVKAKKLSAQSRRLNKALSSWINSVDNERREEFVETLFGLLYASGAKNLSDVSADRLRSTREVIRQYAGLDKDSRTLIKNMLLSLTDKISKARFEK